MNKDTHPEIPDRAPPRWTSVEPEVENERAAKIQAKEAQYEEKDDGRYDGQSTSSTVIWQTKAQLTPTPVRASRPNGGYPQE